MIIRNLFRLIVKLEWDRVKNDKRADIAHHDSQMINLNMDGGKLGKMLWFSEISLYMNITSTSWD